MKRSLTIVHDGSQPCRTGLKHASPAFLQDASSSSSSSQQVDDVGEEDEANDGEKHQHQNVHHVGNAVRDGRSGGEEDTQIRKAAAHIRRCRRSAEIGNVRRGKRIRSAAWTCELNPAPLPRTTNRSDGE